MPVTIKIKCFSCNNAFEHYLCTRKKGDEIICPFCYAEADSQSAKSILEAAAAFHDSNNDLYKHALDKGSDLPLFQFDLLTAYVKL